MFVRLGGRARAQTPTVSPSSSPRSRVDCTPPSSLGMQVDHNTGPGGWVRLVVNKAAGSGGVKSVAMKGSDGAWKDLSNKYGTAW